MPIDGNAGSLTENLIALIEAAGGDRPASKGLQELYQALAVALSAFSPGGGVEQVHAGTNVTITGTTSDPIVNASGGGGGGATIGDTTQFFSADAATQITGDNTEHDLLCIVAAPPSWMDNAGNITAAGLYSLSLQVEPVVAWTTTTSYISFSFGFNGELYPVSALNPALVGSGNYNPAGIVALGAGDLPFSTQCTIIVPTDATGHIQVRVNAWQLASA